MYLPYAIAIFRAMRTPINPENTYRSTPNDHRKLNFTLLSNSSLMSISDVLPLSFITDKAITYNRVNTINFNGFLFLSYSFSSHKCCILWKYFNSWIPIYVNQGRNTSSWIHGLEVLRININGHLLFDGNQISWFQLCTKTMKIGTPLTIVLSQ